MKNTIYLLLFAISFISLSGYARQESTDGHYLEMSREYRINADGSWQYHHTCKLKINSYFAFHNLYGEDFIVYNPLIQKLTIEKSVTTMADGKRVPSPENAYNELLPGFAANAPEFVHLREMVVTHTGLERGAVVDFAYTLTTRPQSLPPMADDVLMMSSPVDKLTYTIQVPNGMNFRYEQFNLDTRPVVNKKGNVIVYTWTIEDLPAYGRDDFRPRNQLGRPRIIFQAGKKGSDEVFRQLAASIPVNQPDEAVGKLVNSITGGKEISLELLLKMQQAVVNDLNYFPVPLVYQQFTPETAGTTLRRNGGTEIDKAVLLAAMIKAAGADAQLVAVISENLYSTGASNPLQIEKFLVKAAVPGNEPVFLSPLQTANFNEIQSLEGKNLVLLSPGKIRLERIPAVKNEIVLSGNFSVDNNLKMKGSADLRLSGRLNPYFRIFNDTSYYPKLLAGAWSASEVKKATASQVSDEQTAVSFDIEKATSLKELPGLLFWRIPALNAGYESWGMTELTSQRTEPLEVPYGLSESYTFTLSLPDGFTKAGNDYHEKISNSFGSLNISISAEGRKLIVMRSLVVHPGVISVSDFPAFRSFINIWNNKKFREVVISKQQ